MNRWVAARSRFGEASTSKTWRYWSMARYSYTHRLATFTCVSSTNQRSPAACRQAATIVEFVERHGRPMVGDAPPRQVIGRSGFGMSTVAASSRCDAATTMKYGGGVVAIRSVAGNRIGRHDGSDLGRRQRSELTVLRGHDDWIREWHVRQMVGG